MMTFISELISSIFQVLLFSLIPFLVWLFTAHKKEFFFSWIGFKKVTSNKKDVLKFGIIAFVLCEIVGLAIYKITLSGDWNRSTSAGLGIFGVPSAILNCFVHTALSEEILFRGFIQKRLQKVLNFKIATAIQAVLFGFAHILPLLDKISFLEGCALGIFPIIPGIIFAYLNEKKADGSIFPSWLLHGLMNLPLRLLQL